MSNKILVNQLELAQAPMTAYEFAVQKDDPVIEYALRKASLYVIGQRPVMTFENLTVDPTTYQLYFEIHQKENPTILKVRFPLIQKVVGSQEEDNIYVSFNFLDKANEQVKMPLHNIHGFSLSKHTDEEDAGEFLIWFSPEKLLNNYWRGQIECEIDGNFRSFTQYIVHYVGKATKQSIIKRLKGHSTLQDILSLATPVTDKQLPANEIVILPFQFKDNLQMQSFGNFGEGSDMGNLIAAFKGEDYPDQERVFLDAEKALIKAMKPNYNKELFNSYPISKDGLHKDNYNVISYTFTDPITLIYDKGQIRGDQFPWGGDAIQIVNGKDLRLVKADVQ